MACLVMLSVAVLVGGCHRSHVDRARSDAEVMRDAEVEDAGFDSSQCRTESGPRFARNGWDDILDAMITPEQLREYAGRDWRYLRDRTIRRAARRWREGGPEACQEVSEALYEHAKRVVPGFPNPADRARDHADHLALLHKLDAVAHLFADA